MGGGGLGGDFLGEDAWEGGEGEWELDEGGGLIFVRGVVCEWYHGFYESVWLMLINIVSVLGGLDGS